MMSGVVVSSNNAKYDKRHDVLHVFLSSCADTFSEEKFPGVYLNRCEDTEVVAGLTIMDFKKRMKELPSILPMYQFKINV